MRLRVQTRNVLHTITFGRLERHYDSEHGYCEDDEGDVGFEFRWHRDAKHWFPDVGSAFNTAMWDQQHADERRLFPGEHWFLGRWADRRMRDTHARMMNEMADRMMASLSVPRGGITFVSPPVESDEAREAEDRSRATMSGHYDGEPIGRSVFPPTNPHFGPDVD